MNQQVQVANERWYAIGIGLLEGITMFWDVCLLLTRRVPKASYKRFPSRQTAEDWLKLVHDIEDAVLLDMAAAKAAVAQHNAATALPAAVPRSSLPSSASPGSLDDATPVSSRPRPTAVPPSRSAAPSSSSSTAAEPFIRTARLTQSPVHARSLKRARRASGDDVTLGSSTADINDRFVNILPALLRLVEIFSSGNAVIITEATIPTPGDDERRSDTSMGLDVSGAYNIPDIEETGCRQEVVKSKGKAKANNEPWSPMGALQGVNLARDTVDDIDDGNSGGGSDNDDDRDGGDWVPVDG
ncbi:hypothetical protein Forpe1208_v008507 [Fusarium oxysporum f. sp. rapae]|uniref:Ribonuclease H1 N-terminal domain-containing protein n=1 Tax=Fusarium oxysporum f. sp. rapae TaxID=485398 RepID=A0A8J5TSB8_FUSOX|nr:hypothetical protein Forpe1208_v008507 [Fusarium oxysporum f. sp. rapae]